MKVQVERNQRVFFLSDPHYAHKNICRGASEWDFTNNLRDFSSVDEMNDTIVCNINKLVREDDILFSLGDWSFGGVNKASEFRERLNVKTIHHILGNHDHHIRNNKEGARDLFTSVKEYSNVTLCLDKGGHHEKFNLVLMHFPICSWDGMSHGVIHLHGHLHLPPHLRVHRGKSMDVGMDGNSLFPISLEEVLDILGENPIANNVITEGDYHE